MICIPGNTKIYFSEPPIRQGESINGNQEMRQKSIIHQQKMPIQAGLGKVKRPSLPVPRTSVHISQESSEKMRLPSSSKGNLKKGKQFMIPGLIPKGNILFECY